MGREVKRVPLEFDWPIDQIWSGYVNPYYSQENQCKDCKGRGTTDDREALAKLIHLIMIAGWDGARNKRPPHPWIADIIGNLRLTPAFHEVTRGLSGRETSFLGHDCIDGWSAMSRILKAAGVDDDKWGICVPCEGHGMPPDIYLKAEEWQKTEPPTGEGWQMWETVSEGSPISPVFPTKEALAEYLSTSTNWRCNETTKEQWLVMIEEEYAPSFISTPELGVVSGVEAAGKLK